MINNDRRLNSSILWGRKPWVPFTRFISLIPVFKVPSARKARRRPGWWKWGGSSWEINFTKKCWSWTTWSGWWFQSDIFGVSTRCLVGRTVEHSVATGRSPDWAVQLLRSWRLLSKPPKKHKKTAGQRVNGKSGFHPQDWWTCLVTFKVSLCRSYFIKPPFMPIHSHIFPWHPHETAETWRHFPAMFRHSDRARTCSARKLSISQELDVKSWKFHGRSSFLIEGSRHMMV